MSDARELVGRRWNALVRMPVMLWIALVLSGCDSHPALATAPSKSSPPLTSSRPFRILFVGNSLTYVNDLPGMVSALSSAAGDPYPIQTGTVAYPDYALEDHFAQGEAARTIQGAGPWDVVAMQQGPSTLPESRENLIDYARRFAVIIRSVGARPALFGIWPQGERVFALDACIESYRAAADSIHGISFPAGLAWKLAWASDAHLPLYGDDQFHPSVLGTYTAALVIYCVVRGRPAMGLPTRFTMDSGEVAIDAYQAYTVQRAVTEATAPLIQRKGGRAVETPGPWLPLIGR